MSVSDLRTRRVPRPWIIAALVLQLISFTVASFVSQIPAQRLLYAILGAISAFVIQCVLALIRPGALGFGDVTACTLMGCMLGWWGLLRYCLWWALLGVFGMIWLLIWNTKRHNQSIPFVPPIVLSACVAILLNY